MSGNGSGARLAVITVTHDSAHVLPEWLAALEAVCDRDAIELCVADSGSSPAQRELLEEQASGRVEHFLTLPNLGFGGGCNAGAAATSAPLLLFLNPDAQVRSLPARVFAGNGLGGALVGGFALDPDRPLGFTNPPGFRSEAEELALGRLSRAYRRRPDDPAWVSGAALLIERADFDHIGGFSPAFFMYFEDADLCMRHRYAGGRVELDAGLVIDHASGKSSGEEVKTSLGPALDGVHRLSGRRFAERHGRPWQGAALYLLMAVAYLPRRLAAMVRDRRPAREMLDTLLCLLRPSRALRVLTSRANR